MSPSIDISETHKEIVQSILREHLTNTCHVWVFGSRATWLAKEYSDLDLAIARKDGTPLSLTVMSALETAFEDSLLPWKVDVVDLHGVSEEFRAAIERDKVLFSLGVGGEWKEVELANYCSKIGSGATPRGGNQVYLDKGIVSLIRSQNIHNDGFKKNGLVYISEEEADKLKNVTVENNDVLLNITGDSVARVCNASKELLPARVNQHVAIIRTNPTKLDPHFLRYILVSPSKQSLLLTLASAGATRNALTKNMIEKLTIYIPPLPEQKAIAHILGTLDDKIELNRQTNQTLEAMAQALFQSWFVDFDPVIDKALAAGNEIPEAFQAKAAARQALGDQRQALPEEVTSLFPDSFVFTEEMGWVPEGWEVAKFGHIAKNIRVPADPNSLSQNTLYVGLEHIDRQSFSLSKWGYASAVDSQKSRFEHTDFLFGKLRPYFHKVCQVQSAGICSTDILVIRAITNIFSGYVGCQLFEADFVEYANQRSTGTRMPRASWKDMSEYKIALPPSNLIEKFNTFVQPTRKKCALTVQEITTLSNLRDTILPKLISGELRVADAEGFLGEVSV